jgi:Cu(I)/Ag(I) efflux system membrane fusion protein
VNRASLVAILCLGLSAGWTLSPSVLGAKAAEPARTPLYYQDPNGKPFYAAGPKKAVNGRDYVPVYDDAAPAIAGSSPPEAGEAAPRPAQAPAPSGQPADRGRILYYRNPMGLPDTSPVPKKDPMGMAYLPVYENEAADAGAGVVTVAPGRLQVLGVRTAPVESRPTLTRTVRATGTVQFDERRMAVVTTRVAGWIEHLDVAATGDPVRRGQALAEIYSPDLVASEEEYLVAVHLGSGLATGSLQRLQALGVPEAEIARLRRTNRVAQRISVLAPADGVVTEKMVVEGTRVGPDQPLYKTASLSPVWLIAEVQEQDLGAVRPGEKAQASFVAYPGRAFGGTVDFIYPSLSAETRTGRVRIVMPNPDQALRAGMYAEVSIQAPAGAASGPVLVVPASAVLDSGTRQVVLVEKGEGRFEPRPVRIGAQGDGETQVLDGLKAGERVVVGANFLIDSESNLRAALQGFSAGADHKPQATQPGATP